jgi:hypothetical protein
MLTKGSVFKSLFPALFFVVSIGSQARSSSINLSPQDIITPKQQAKYFENRLGAIEVGVTDMKTLEWYIGEGEDVKNGNTERTYYVDTKNNKTLIVDTTSQGIIEVVTYRGYVDLPPGYSDPKEIKVSKKLNIKNLMTSTGSRIGYSYSRIISAYGKPSVDIKNKNLRELKYIMLGSLHSDIDFVYLEYSFRLVNNKVVEIRIENGK